MSNTKHTPGPWTTNQSEPHCIEATDHPSNGTPLICEMFNSSHIPQDEQLANARLIASAPDLLEALQAFAAVEAFEGWHPKYRDAIEKAEAAIAKATEQ